MGQQFRTHSRRRRSFGQSEVFTTGTGSLTTIGQFTTHLLQVVSRASRRAAVGICLGFIGCGEADLFSPNEMDPSFQTYCYSVESCSRLFMPQQRYYDVFQAIGQMNDSSEICSEMKNLAQNALDFTGVFHYDWYDGHFGWAYTNYTIDLSPLNWDFEGELVRTVAHEAYHLYHYANYGNLGSEFLADTYMDACTIR